MNFPVQFYSFPLVGLVRAMRGAEGEEEGGGAVRGGNIYWARKEVTDFKGIVVIFAWVSVPHPLLRDFVDLYSSLRWNSIVCYAHYLSA